MLKLLTIVLDDGFVTTTKAQLNHLCSLSNSTVTQRTSRHQSSDLISIPLWVRVCIGRTSGLGYEMTGNLS